MIPRSESAEPSKPAPQDEEKNYWENELARQQVEYQTGTEQLGGVASKPAEGAQESMNAREKWRKVINPTLCRVAAKLSYEDARDLIVAFAEAYASQENPALREQVEGLRAALQKYGDHLNGCNRDMCWHAEHAPECCDCGFEALAAPKEKE